LTFEFLGTDAGNAVHVFVGYGLFIVWVVAFWSIAFKYLNPRPAPLITTTTTIAR
jgi:hypothetical protein